MENSKPLVSIGMPVFNGERFIRQTLDSLLAQDYRHFEINISDNASSDQTGNICREYAAKDNRILYYRNESNLGSCVNFDKVLQLASGKYFMWAADHDLWRPTFISRCVSVLEQEPEVVIVYPQAILIDVEDNFLEMIPEQIETRGMNSALQRYKELIWNIAMCNMAVGLIRRNVLTQVGKFRNVYGADYILLAELLLRGKSAHISEPLFYLRKNRPEEWTDGEKYKKRLLFFLNPATAAERSKKSMHDLYLEMVYAFLKMLLFAPLSLTEKLEAARETIRCFENRLGVLPPLVPLLRKLKFSLQHPIRSLTNHHNAE